MLMEARQAGVITLEEQLKILNKVYEGSPPTALKQMAIEAWDRPLMRTDEHKQRYITEFENKWFGSCMKVVVAREGAE